MKKSATIFFVKICFLSAPVVFIIILYLAFDPFKVLYSYSSYYISGEPSYVLLNRDYVSTQTFIQNYPTFNYDSFVFGNSRSLFYEIKDWEKHISSKKCFHFDAAGETIYGINKKINYLSENNINIKNALIILDYTTLYGVSNSKGHLFLKHPILCDGDYYSFQIEYIKTFFDFNFLKSYLLFRFLDIKSILIDDRPIDYNIENNELKFLYYENMINKNPDDYYLPRKSVFFKRDSIQQYSPVVIKRKQEVMLTEISNILRKNNTSYKIIINPLYDQKKLNIEDLSILNALFGKENVFDFSGINQITNNLYNYYETSHYRPHVAKKIIDEIYLH
jgi:hypothetical protein